MKSLSILLVFTLLSSGCALAELPKAKVTYRIVDQQGNPIEGAHVDVGFIEASGRSVTGYTDTNGIFVAEDISSGGAGSLVKMEGYYWGGEVVITQTSIDCYIVSNPGTQRLRLC